MPSSFEWLTKKSKMPIHGNYESSSKQIIKFYQEKSADGFSDTVLTKRVRSESACRIETEKQFTFTDRCVHRTVGVFAGLHLDSV